jgi:putative tricarboxylic transport membrane protein
MRDVIGGLILVVVAAVAAWQGSALSVGTPRHIGPGMVPVVLSALIALIGVILIGLGYREARAHRDRWPLRGPVFILGSAVIFGLVIRPLGLAVAGPLLVIVGALATDESRWFEVALFALGMTVFCVVLFKHLLSLPIPLAPWLIGY